MGNLSTATRDCTFILQSCNKTKYYREPEFNDMTIRSVYKGTVANFAEGLGFRDLKGTANKGTKTSR